MVKHLIVFDSVENCKKRVVLNEKYAVIYSRLLGNYYMCEMRPPWEELDIMHDIVDLTSVFNTFEYDFDEAIKWFAKAAELGCYYSIPRLFNTYIEKQNFEEALKYLKLGQKFQMPSFIEKLADWYSRGQQVDRDLVQAEKLWRRAARLGNLKAQYEIGMMHKFGRGDSFMDKKEAYAWIYIAAEGGYENAAQEIYEMESEFGKSYLASVKNYADNFLNKIIIKKKYDWSYWLDFILKQIKT